MPGFFPISGNSGPAMTAIGSSVGGATGCATRQMPSPRRNGATACPGRAFRLLFAVVACLGLPVQAWAQTAEQALPPVIGRESGLHSGEFVLHPAVGVQGHYDTNLFNGNVQEYGNAPVSATSIRIRPSLSLQNDLSSNTAFNFNSSGEGRVYLSDNKNVTAQDGIGGAANLDLTFGQKKAISFSMFEHFNRVLRAQNWDTIASLNSNNNDVGGRIEFHPGDHPERRPFVIAAIGSFGIQRFEEFTAGNANTLRTRLTGSWRFLPKTAALVDLGWDFMNYVDSTSSTSLVKMGLSQNSKPFRAKVGMAGALTKRVTVDVGGGWGLSMSEGPSTYSGYLASLAIGLRPAEATRVTVGYNHDFRTSFYGTYASFHRASISLLQRFGKIVDFKGAFGYSYVTFGPYVPTIGVNGTPLSVSAGTRHDNQLDATLSASFDVSRLLAVDLGYALRQVITGYKVCLNDCTVVSNANRVLDVGAYQAHEIFATVTVRY